MVKIQGNKFFLFSCVLTLSDCDVVLGVQCLKTLGPIIWNFLKMTSEFQERCTSMVLQGLCTRETSIEDGSCFFKPYSIEKKG